MGSIEPTNLYDDCNNTRSFNKYSFSSLHTVDRDHKNVGFFLFDGNTKIKKIKGRSQKNDLFSIRLADTSTAFNEGPLCLKLFHNVKKNKDVKMLLVDDSNDT